MKLNSNFTFEKYGLQLRFVNEDDAEFILKLRTDLKLSKFIHKTSSDIEKQKEWIRNYKKREANGEDYYFIFHKNGVPVGLNRIYWIKEDSFTTGSWVFDPHAPFECAIQSALIVRIIGFDILGKKIENGIDGVHKDNVKVIKFNRMLGLDLKPEGDILTGSLKKEVFEKTKIKIEKLLQLNN